MGVYNGMEQATHLASATFTAAGQTTTPLAVTGKFNLFVGGGGTFTGTIRLEASADGGATFLPVTAMGNVVLIAAEAAEMLEQHEPGVLIRARCMTLSAGTIPVRISQ